MSVYVDDIAFVVRDPKDSITLFEENKNTN